MGTPVDTSGSYYDWSTATDAQLWSGSSHSPIFTTSATIKTFDTAHYPDGFAHADEPLLAMWFATLSQYNLKKGNPDTGVRESTAWYCRLDTDDDRLWVCQRRLYWDEATRKYKENRTWQPLGQFTDVFFANDVVNELINRIKEAKNGRIRVMAAQGTGPTHNLLEVHSIIHFGHWNKVMLKHALPRQWMLYVKHRTYGAGLRQDSEVGKLLWHYPSNRETLRTFHVNRAYELKRLIKFGNVKDSESVLDLGCGNGDAGRLIMAMRNSDRQKNVFFCDPSPANIRATRDNIRNKYGRTQVTSGRFYYGFFMIEEVCQEMKASFGQTQGFDVVIAHNVMTWFDFKDHAKVLESLANLVKPDGRIVLDIPVQATHQPFYCTVPVGIIATQPLNVVAGKHVTLNYPRVRGTGRSSDKVGKYWVTPSECSAERQKVQQILDASRIPLSILQSYPCFDPTHFHDRTMDIESDAPNCKGYYPGVKTEHDRRNVARVSAALAVNRDNESDPADTSIIQELHSGFFYLFKRKPEAV